MATVRPVVRSPTSITVFSASQTLSVGFASQATTKKPSMNSRMSALSVLQNVRHASVRLFVKLAKKVITCPTINQENVCSAHPHVPHAELWIIIVSAASMVIPKISGNVKEITM